MTLIDFNGISHSRTGHAWGIFFMMQAWWLFVASSIIYVVVSILTPAPDYLKIESYTMSSPLAFLKKEKDEKYNIPLLLSGILVMIMILLYSLFK